MKTPLVPFNSFAPDRADIFLGGSPLVKNVVPTVDGYRPLKQFTRFSDNGLTARPRGLISVKDDAGASHLYAGDKTKLYKLLGTSFSDASSSVSGTYDLGTSGVWEFARFQSRIIAACPDLDHQPQQATLGSLTFSTTLITSTDKPKMKHIAALRDFVVGGNISSTAGGLTPSRVWWSAIRDPQDWTPNRATQCDYQDLAFGGQVQRVMGGVEYAVVFQEDVIRRMNYIGAGAVFDIDVVDRRRGTLIPTGCVGWGRYIFYIAPEGFMAFDGVQSVPIGENYVDDFFYDNFDSQNHALVTAGVDPVRKNVFWSYPGEGNVGLANTTLVYHWPEKKWACISEGYTMLGQISSPGYTLEQLDNISTDMDDDDALGPSLDAARWKGGAQELAVMDFENYLGYFDGSNMQAILETAETELVTGRRSQVNGIRPIIQGLADTGVHACVGHRKRLTDPIIYSGSNEINADGVCNQHTDDRYTRACVTLSASTTWSLAVGVIIEYEESGDR